MKVNYYEILGVERSASEAEIRTKFRQLARQQHPDRYEGDDKASAERKFQALTEAVNVLTSPERRKQHDAQLQAGSGRSATDPAAVARAYVAQGVKSYKEGNFAQAAQNFDMAVKHHAEDAKAFHYLALAAARMPNGLRQAVNAIESAVQLEPYNPTYLKEAGMLCRRAGLTAKAERHLEEALKWDAENAEVKKALDEIRHERESKEGGKGLFESLLRKS